MEKMFIAYLVKDNNIEEKDRDILVKEISDNKYQEIITGNIFENYRYSNDDMTVWLWYRIDPALHNEMIIKYLKYETDRVKSIINDSKMKKICK